MPILIDEFEVVVEPGGIPAEGGGEPGEAMPMMPEEAELAALLVLLAERRARLLVD